MTSETGSSGDRSPATLPADAEYEIHARETGHHRFEVTLTNEAARRALATGQTRRTDDSATTLGNAIDGALEAIGEDLDAEEAPLAGRRGVRGERTGTAYRFRIEIVDPRRRRVFGRCSAASGVGREETMRRLAACVLRLILFENEEREDPEVHPLLGGETAHTVH